VLRTSSSADGRATYLMRAHLLERIATALQDAGTDALLVKGAALALTHYPSPWVRDMCDIDLLVRPGELGKVLDALTAAGLERAAVAGSRSLTGALFGETILIARVATASMMVEVHTGLDKLVARPVDHAGIFARARAAPGLPGLLVPADEDHVLLVALHEASHEFDHTVGFIDLYMLLRSRPDQALLVARAREWRLTSVLYVALATLQALDPSFAPMQLVESCDPGPLRRAALARFYDIGHFPVARRSGRLGLQWVVRQTPLRDDLGAWAVGVTRYAGLRALERLGLG